MTTAHHRMFIVMIEVETFALFSDGLEPTTVRAATNGHSQTRFDGPQDRDESLTDTISAGDSFNELFFANLG